MQQDEGADKRDSAVQQKHTPRLYTPVGCFWDGLAVCLEDGPPLRARWIRIASPRSRRGSARGAGHQSAGMAPPAGGMLPAAVVGSGRRGERPRSQLLCKLGPKEAQKTCQFGLLTFWLLTFWLLTVPSPLYIVSRSVLYTLYRVTKCLTDYIVTQRVLYTSSPCLSRS